MNRFRNPSKFRIGDGLAQFEFALRQASLVHNTEKINVINLTKTNGIPVSNSNKKSPRKKSINYDPRRNENDDFSYSDFLETLEFNDINFSISDQVNDDKKIETQFEIHPPSIPYHYSPTRARSNKSAKSQSINSLKYDHLNDKSNIRKRNKNENNFLPTPSLSSFRVPEQLRQLMLSFSQLEYVVRDFLRNNQYYIQFAEKWKYFSDSFDRFIETASLHFSSNFNYTSDSQCFYRQITKATPVYLTSEIIVNNFSEFIQQSTEIQSQSSQYIFSIQKEFERIHKLISKTRNSMAQNRYKTDIPCIKLEEFQNNVISLNEELFPKNFLNSPSKMNLNLNKKRLHRQICELNREIFEIFHKHLKYSFINLAIKIQIRTDLSSCISNIEESLLVAERTGSFVKNLKDCIASTNRELTKILNLMGFPYHVDLASFDEKNDSKSNISNGSNQTVNRVLDKELKKINNLIYEIDSEIKNKEKNHVVEISKNERISIENNSNNEGVQIKSDTEIDFVINENQSDVENQCNSDKETDFINNENQIFNEKNSENEINIIDIENNHVDNEFNTDNDDENKSAVSNSNVINNENIINNEIDSKNEENVEFNNYNNLDDENHDSIINDIDSSNANTQLNDNNEKLENRDDSNSVNIQLNSNVNELENENSSISNESNLNDENKSTNNDDGKLENKDDSNSIDIQLSNNVDELKNENSSVNNENNLNDENKSVNDYDEKQDKKDDSNEENYSINNDVDLLDEKKSKDNYNNLSNRSEISDNVFNNDNDSVKGNKKNENELSEKDDFEYDENN